jgi:hypothetical protein
LQRLLFVNERENAREDPKAVESFSIGSYLRFGEGGVVAEHEQAVRDGLDKALEILERIVSSPANIGGGEEAEYIFW